MFSRISARVAVDAWPDTDSCVAPAATCSRSPPTPPSGGTINKLNGTSDLFSVFQRLVDEPSLRRPYPDIPPYWRNLAGSHAVFYRIAEDSELIVVRVLHARMLPELHLTDEPADQ